MSISKFLFSDPINRMAIRHLGLLVRRSELVAGNIANADTPGYKAKDLDFRQVLERIARGGEERSKLRLARTNPRHLPGLDLGPADARVVEDRRNLRVDRNSVNVENELQKSAEIALTYDLLATYLKHKGGLLREAMRSDT